MSTVSYMCVLVIDVKGWGGVLFFVLRWMSSYCLVFMDDGAEAQIVS